MAHRYRKSGSLDLTPLRSGRESLSDSFELGSNVHNMSANDENSPACGAFGSSGIKRSETLADTPTYGYVIKKRRPSPLDRVNGLNGSDQSTPLRGLSQNNILLPAPQHQPQQHVQLNEANIMHAVQKSDAQPDLIGDCSKMHALPLISGKHQDLKSISPETLAALMNEQFVDLIDSYEVIDCRYPYEYEGGHIAGALNLYTREEVAKKFFGEQQCQMDVENAHASSKRTVLIFHCEFSSERGPNLLRYLRSVDREINQNAYPRLHHPEIYILNGGYKAFFEKFRSLCDPTSYMPMNADREACRHFRQKSKSWNCETKWANQSRSLKF